MKISFVTILVFLFSIINVDLFAQPKPDTSGQTAEAKHLFIDVHQLEPGKVKYEAVAEAHKKDLAVQNKYGVNFINYWVDEKTGVVMCLSEAKDSKSIKATHKEAHGLIPSYILKVKQGD